MKAIVVGCGRVGSAVAKKLTKSGWDVTAIDENEEALARLGEHWSGGFVVGHGMDVNVLREAGIEEADAVVVATNGDNTNIVVGQVAQKRFGIECTVVRILDPARAELYATLGLRTVSPTSTAIEVLSEAVKSCAVRPRARSSGRVLMFVLVAGGGKVGSNVARTLRRIGHEVTIIEQRATASPISRRSSSTPRSSVTRPRSSCSSAPASRARRTSSSPSRETTRTTWSSARWRASATASRR